MTSKEAKDILKELPDRITEILLPSYKSYDYHLALDLAIKALDNSSDKQDLAVADKLDTFVSKLTQGDDISSGRMSKEEYIEIVSSLRYAISSLRGGNK